MLASNEKYPKTRKKEKNGLWNTILVEQLEINGFNRNRPNHWFYKTIMNMF